MTWLKNKISNGWNWLKRRGRRFWLAITGTTIALASGGTILLNQVVPSPSIPAEFQLKTSKENIIGVLPVGKYIDGTDSEGSPCTKCEIEIGDLYNPTSKEVQAVDPSGKLGTYTHFTADPNDAIQYAYKSSAITKETGELVRIPNAVVYNVDDKGNPLPENTFRMSAHGGDVFYEEDGTWYDVKTAITRRDHFDTQTAPTVLERIKSFVFGEEVFAIDISVYGDNDDVGMGYTDATWATARDAATAETVDAVTTQDEDIRQFLSSGTYQLSRYFGYFHTSSIPDSATISAVDFKFTRFGALGSCPQQNLCDWHIVGHTAASQPATDVDWDTIGSTSYGTVSVDATGSYTVTLNSSGESAISKTGVTKIGIRGDHDLDDNAPTEAAVYRGLYTADEDTTSNRPFLDITYTVADAGASWCDTDYSNRKQLFIDDDLVDDDLTNFPLWVALDSDVTGTAQSDGDDIFFVESANCTKLDTELQDADSDITTGSPGVWVKTPSVASSTETVLHMYYGNASASSNHSSAAVWDSNYKLVWHLEEEPDADSGTDEILDSTSNNNDGDSVNLDTGADVAAKLGVGIDFDDDPSGDAIERAGISITSAYTWCLWANADDVPGSSGFSKPILNGKTSDSMGFSWTHSNSSFRNAVYHRDSGTNYIAAQVDATDDHQWYLLCATWDGSTVTSYQDGFSNNTGSDSTINTISGNFTISHDLDEFDGTIDEVRLSDVDRGAAWIKFKYYNEAGLYGVPAFGAEESVPASIQEGDGSFIDWW